MSWTRAFPVGKGGKRWVFNPNDTEQDALHHAILAAMKEEVGQNVRPVFGRNEPVFVSITFLVPRPAYHFDREGDRSAGNILPEHNNTFSTVTPDIDNLLKFHLDKPFKGLLYHDDRQVTAVFMRKTFDVLEDCRGHTEITLQKDTFTSKYVV